MLTKVKPIFRFHALIDRNRERIMFKAISTPAVTSIFVFIFFIIKTPFVTIATKGVSHPSVAADAGTATRILQISFCISFVLRQHPIHRHFTRCPYSDRNCLSAHYFESSAFFTSGIIQPPTALPSVFTIRNRKALPLHIPAMEM